MQQIENLVIDMDGVLWRGVTPIVPLAGLFDRLRALGIGYVFATNNASRTVAQYVQKLGGYGVAVAPWQILTSAETTAAYIAQEYAADSRVYVVGDEGLHYAVRQRGFKVVNVQGQAIAVQHLGELARYLSEADIVVAGFSHRCHYLDLAQAAYYIDRGADFIGTNGDVSFPSEIGPLPGAGSLLALLQAATGVEPLIIGKPNRPVFLEALRRLEGSAATTLMVGDRLATDIVGGRNAGLQTALLFSGVTSREQAAVAADCADFEFEHFGALVDALERSRQEGQI